MTRETHISGAWVHADVNGAEAAPFPVRSSLRWNAMSARGEIVSSSMHTDHQEVQAAL
jgi:hypothetical protein